MKAPEWKTLTCYGFLICAEIHNIQNRKQATWQLISMDHIGFFHANKP